MTVGIVFEEKILNEISSDAYLQNYVPLISHVEFGPNFNQYSTTFYKHIIEKSIDLNTEINFHFHLPHFHNEKLSVEHFIGTNKNEVFEFYRKLNEVINLKAFCPTLVFHGAQYKEDKKEAFYKTKQFIDESINFFIQRNMPLKLSIETLNGNKKKCIGEKREDLMQLTDYFLTKHLGICWDLTHDYMNCGKFIHPSDKFLTQVNHVHIHGFKGGEAHLNLRKDIFTKIDISSIQSTTIPIIVELLYCNDYLTKLSSDINLLTNQLSKRS